MLCIARYILGRQPVTSSIEDEIEIYNSVDLAKHVFDAGYHAGGEDFRLLGGIYASTSDKAWLRYLAEQPMSTTDLWNALEKVLRDKGASDAWLRYAMPDLHTMAMQFSLGEFHRGYVAHERGEGCGAYDPPRVGIEDSFEHDLGDK